MGGGVKGYDFCSRFHSEAGVSVQRGGLEGGGGRGKEARSSEIDSNRYLNGEMVEEVSRKERWRQKRKQSGEVERVSHPSVESADLPHSLSPSLAEAICTWVPHLRRQPSHNFPQMAVATSVTHGKASSAAQLCMLRSTSHRP